MSPGSYIALLDPALADHKGTESSNLGDLIISNSVIGILQDLFPKMEILRFPTHSFLTRGQMKLINNAWLGFIGGTNLLHSDMLHQRQLMLRDGKLLWLFPGIQNLILMGCGWGPQPEMKMKIKTKLLFKKILHPEFKHACRDRFSVEKMEKEAKIPAINTACPTMWGLDGCTTNLTGRNDTCLFTLTDYAIDRTRDSRMIEILLDHFNKLVFFPQGMGDMNYLYSLPVYTANKSKFSVLPHSIDEFYRFVKGTQFIYAGTRLHCGIYCLTENVPAMIIGIDNRSSEIAKDTYLPVCPGNHMELMVNWLNQQKVFEYPVTLPLSSIKNWKKQFIN